MINGLRPSLLPTTLSSLCCLINDCLHDIPSRRPSFSEILTRLQNEVQVEIAGDTEKVAIERRAILQQHRENRKPF